jgi:hypothetical protein
MAGAHVEALRSPKEIELLNLLASRLQREAPHRWKCIFLNCELRETAGGMSASGDLFAVTKPMFSHPKRNQWVLGADSLKILYELGRLVCAQASLPHVTVDLIIPKAGGFRSYADFGELRRLDGGDDFFRSKHKVYEDVEPLLKLIG